MSNRWTMDDIKSRGLKIAEPARPVNFQIPVESKQPASFALGRMKAGKIAEVEVIYGNPPSKSNCYKIVTISGHGSLAKTAALKKYENDFFIQCKYYRNKNIEGYFELEVKVFYPSQRSDLDNSLKCLLDCLQEIKAIENDNKCVKITAEKYLDKLNPRVEFKVIPV